MASSIKKCEICGKEFNYTCGAFTQHLLMEHDLSLEEYVIKFDYNGIPPKCKCGYCNERPPFIRGKFLDFIGKHKIYKWRNEQYVKKYGKPICKTCGKKVGFIREKPKQYCSKKCFPNNWNQEKIKISIKEKYNVINISQLPENRKNISEKNKKNAQLALEKRMKTVKRRYGVNSVMQHEEFFKKQQNSSLKRHNYKNTNLIYQGSYELDFLEFCEMNKILDKLTNGHTYKLNESIYTTEFSLGDYEIEIKSSWIMKKQGGIYKILEKKNAVEKEGKKYIFILDKDYSIFTAIMNI